MRTVDLERRCVGAKKCVLGWGCKDIYIYTGRLKKRMFDEASKNKYPHFCFARKAGTMTNTLAHAV